MDLRILQILLLEFQRIVPLVGYSWRQKCLFPVSVSRVPGQLPALRLLQLSDLELFRGRGSSLRDLHGLGAPRGTQVLLHLGFLRWAVLGEGCGSTVLRLHSALVGLFAGPE